MSNGAASAEVSFIEPPTSTVLLPMKRVVELPLPAAEGDADDGLVLEAGCVGTLPLDAEGDADDGRLLGAWLVGTLPPVAVGVTTLSAGTSFHC